MDDLISRKEAIKSIIDNSPFDGFREIERLSCGYGEDEAIATMAALEAIKGLTSSKPDISTPKEGKWIYLGTPTVHGKCSCCGFEAHYYEDDVYGYDYCPNCGARLRLSEDNT